MNTPQNHLRKNHTITLAKSAQKHPHSPTQPIDYQPLTPNTPKIKTAQKHPTHQYPILHPQTTTTCHSKSPPFPPPNTTKPSPPSCTASTNTNANTTHAPHYGPISKHHTCATSSICKKNATASAYSPPSAVSPQVSSSATWSTPTIATTSSTPAPNSMSQTALYPPHTAASASIPPSIVSSRHTSYPWASGASPASPSPPTVPCSNSYSYKATKPPGYSTRNGCNLR